MYQFGTSGYNQECAEMAQGGMSRIQIKARRNLKNLTLEQVADLAEVSHATVQRWEKGTRQPRPENLEKLAYALGCSVGDLYRAPNSSAHGTPEIKIMDSPPGENILPKETIDPVSPNGNNLPDQIGGDPVQNSKLILRAIRNMHIDFAKFSQELGGQMSSMAQHIQGLGDAIEKAEEAEQEALEVAKRAQSSRSKAARR